MPDAAAHAARFDLWAGGETLEAGPTACSMRWRPRKPLVECTCPDIDVSTLGDLIDGVIETVKGWNPDCLASHGRPANAPVTEDLRPVPPPVAAALTFTGADMEAASAAVRALHAPPVDAGSEPQTYATGGVVETEGFVLIAEDDGCTGRMPWVDVRPWWRRMLGGTR